MARNISPFAALTNEEKQIKWMEYQSIRLPYTKVDQACCVHSRPNGKEVPESEMAKRSSEESESLPHYDSEIHNQRHSRPLPPPEVFVKQPAPKPKNSRIAPSPYQQINDFQQSHHRQYAAVIERMKQAEKKTGQFNSWTKEG